LAVSAPGHTLRIVSGVFRTVLFRPTENELEGRLSSLVPAIRLYTS
jgi:hypothetical protein